MKVLFDQNLPRRLRRHLPGHLVITSREMGWSELKNGDLLNAAEIEGFDVFITGDQSLAYQQNLNKRKIAIIELTRNNWPHVTLHIAQIAAAVGQAKPSSYRIINCG